MLATCRRHLAPYAPAWGALDVARLIGLCDEVDAELARAAAEDRAPRLPGAIPRLSGARA